MTMAALAENLNIFLKKYPDLANKEVMIGYDCGWEQVALDAPFKVGVPVMSEKFKDQDNWVRIASGDDGMRIDHAIEDWVFLEN